MVARSVLFASLVLAPACSLLVGTEDLAGGHVDGSVASSSGDGSSGGPSEDSRAADGPAADANDAEAGVAASPCTSTHAFCDDFEDGGVDLLSRWTSIDTNGGTMSITTERAVSPPRSVRTMLVPGPGNRDTKLVKTVAVVGGNARIDLDVFVERDDGGYTEVDPIEVVFRPGPAGYDHAALYVTLESSRTTLQYFLEKVDGGGYDEQRAAIPFAFGRWHHVTLTYTSEPPRVAVAIDGTTSVLDAVAGPPVTSLDVAIGAPYARDIGSTWTIDTDNVVVDTP